MAKTPTLFVSYSWAHPSTGNGFGDAVMVGQTAPIDREGLQEIRDRLIEDRFEPDTALVILSWQVMK